MGVLTRRRGEGLFSMSNSSPSNELIEKCHCRSHFRDTGEHANACPLYEEPEPINSRFEILDL